MQSPTIAPKYEIKRLEGQVIHRIAKYDPKAKEKGKHPITYEDTLVDAGYIVAFPNGHSIRISEQTATRMGFLSPAGKVDMNTGEDVPEMEMTPLAKLDRAGVPLVNLVPAEGD